MEVSIEKQRGTICDASWDNKDASVLCREKGYSEGVAVPGAAYGQGSGRKAFCVLLHLLLCVILVKKGVIFETNDFQP